MARACLSACPAANQLAGDLFSNWSLLHPTAVHLGTEGLRGVRHAIDLLFWAVPQDRSDQTCEFAYRSSVAQDSRQTWRTRASPRTLSSLQPAVL